MTTKVIYRDFGNNETIALFPKLPGTNDPSTCMSYMHVGQHGSADVSIMKSTEPARILDIEKLQCELVSLGYDDLVQIHRFSHHHLAARKKAIDAVSNQAASA